MSIEHMIVSDAREYLRMSESIAGLIDTQIQHIARCDEPEEDCDHGTGSHVTNVIEEMKKTAGDDFWSLPRSMSYLDAKRAIQTILDALDSTQQEIPR